MQNIVVYFGASRDFSTESRLEFNSLYLKREENYKLSHNSSDIFLRIGLEQQSIATYFHTEVLEMAIEAIKGAGMVYQGSTSTAQIKEQAQGRTEVSSEDNQVVSDSIARNIQAMNTKETSGESAGDAGAQGQAQAGQLDKGNAQLKKAVDDINKSALADQSEAVFGIHEKTNRVTIKIVDKKTKEVIKEFPPEKTLDMIAKVWEMAGLMVDEKR